MPEFDVVVRGGTLIDGTGAQARTGDVAVIDGVIAEVGHIEGRGKREVNADGAIVTPGFVDIHTHYDGQATWDQTLAPSSWHGVTTVVMGNCGVGFAPARIEDHDRLIQLMEGVEDIPGATLTEGLAWNWKSFPEFLDALEALPHDIDYAAQVPHAALRVSAMGERAAAHELASDEEISLMAKLAKEAIKAGALGFSTSRTLNHKSSHGELTPSYGAGIEELAAIAAAIGETGAGVLQLVTDWIDTSVDFDIVRQMLKSGRPMSLSVIQRREDPERYREVLSFIKQCNADGFALRGQVATRGIGILLGLQCTLHPFMVNPVWQAISHLPVAEQAARMADPAVKAAMLAAQTDTINPTVVGGNRVHAWEAMFELSDPPNYEPSPADSIAAVAQRTGNAPEEVSYDMIVRDGGRAMIYMPFSNYAYGNLDSVREMLLHPHTVPGLSDGGAHVGTICDASFPTTLLQYWARDRTEGNLELPFVIQRQARDTARTVGLNDRGELRVGFRADLNVIDFDALHLHRPELRWDLPAGGRRFVQRVDGYLHTLVAGVETYAQGEATGELPGRLVRGGRTAPAGADSN
jgi:N-acyl-D-aspartate/D-glutamate deacylase